MKNNVIKLKRKPVLDELPDDLITISNFAKKYGISKSHIYGLINKGAIKRYKYGYFKISEQQACLVVNEAG